MNKSILITGASGFIGSFLVEKALSSGWETWAGIRRTSSKEYLKNENIHFIDLNFSNKELLKDQISTYTTQFGKWDYIVHSAGVTKCLHVSDFDRINYLFTVNFIEALRETGNIPEKFVLMSSLSAREPDTYYGASKQKAEKYLQHLSDFPHIILRPTGVYGPREKDYYLMLKTMKSGLNISVGFETQYLTFVYVKDLVKAVFLAFETDLTNKIYPVSDGKTYTDSEYTRLAGKLLGKKNILQIKIPLCLLYLISCLSEFIFRIAGKTSTLNRDKFKLMKRRNWECEIRPLINDLGFHPEYHLEQGLKESIDWYKTNGWL